MGKTTKFLLSCLQQDSDRGRSCSCSRTFLQRCTTDTGCCSPVLCAGVRAQPAPGQEQPGLLQRPSEEKEGILFRPEPFRGSVHGCRNPQEALLSSLEHFSSHKYNNTTTTGCALCEECSSFCKTALLGEKGSGNCLPHPSCRA